MFALSRILATSLQVRKVISNIIPTKLRIDGHKFDVINDDVRLLIVVHLQMSRQG